MSEEMIDMQMRFEVLKLAVHEAAFESSEDAITMAQAFYGFIKGVTPNE